MATIDDGFRFNTWWGIGDAWSAKTTYGTTDSDNNRFYVGGSSTRGRTRLGFTIPTSYTGPTELIIGMRPDETATISYMRAFLTTNGSINSDADVWASASILASSYFYSDINCTSRITGETINWIYCKFNYNFTPGTTYYIGIFPYASSTSIGNTNYPAVWFRGRNAADYLWSRLTYKGTHTLTLKTTTGVASFTGGGTFDPGTTAYSTATASTGYHLTKYTGTISNGSGTDTWTSCAGLTTHQESWQMDADRTITVYADPNYAVLFYYPNGGTLNSSTYLISTGSFPGSIRSTSTEYLQTVSYGESADPFNATTFGLTRLGYTFKGWAIATSADGITSTVLDQDTKYAATTYVSYGNKNNNVTNANNFPCCLYAAWTANTYTIKYNGNGNTGGSTASSTHTYDSSKVLTTNGFTKTGYVFQGWATSASGPVVYTDGQSVKNITSTNGGVINLYAVWTANTYTIKYNGNGNTGGSTSSSTHTYDESKPLTENGFTKTGYAFEGWSLNPSGPIIYMNRQIVKNLTTVNNDIIDLYANWVICKKGKDIIPFIYTNSANQMMMPKIFYNGEWRWFLINILPEQIVAAKAFVNIDSDAIIDSVAAVTNKAKSFIMIAENTVTKKVQPYLISANGVIEIVQNSKANIVLANTIRGKADIEIKQIANFLSTAYATMNNTALLFVEAINNSIAAFGVNGKSLLLIDMTGQSKGQVANVLHTASNINIPYQSSAIAKSAQVLYLNGQNFIKINSSMSLSNTDYLLTKANNKINIASSLPLTLAQYCYANIKSQLDIEANIPQHGIACWEYPRFVDGALLITQVYSAIQNNDCVEIDSEDAKLITFCDWDGKVLYSCAVHSGDNCPDPIKNGSIEQPVGREPSAYYTYGEFLGWSESPDGEINSTILDNVSQNLKLYAIYKKETRYYTVNFYDGDTLMKTEKVTYGTTVTPPTDTEKDGYTFVGWNPDNFVITQDTDFIGVWEKQYILPETTATFTENTQFGCYQSTELTLPKVLELGKTYMVEWDGTQYLCTAKAIHYNNDYGYVDIKLALGNSGILAEWFGAPNVPDVSPTGEPFILAGNTTTTSMYAYTQDTSTTHTISICAAPLQ